MNKQTNKQIKPHLKNGKSTWIDITANKIYKCPKGIRKDAERH